ncbi:MAG TPA: tyrosine-protein phosphatase [Candidatus Acidoferrum sp.]|nr:tyrosine-protein phosphatase [Candidatus Acidoferrum sp.]
MRSLHRLNQSPKRKHRHIEKNGNPRIVVDFELLRTYAAQNFRDLGGHPTADGRRVRTGKIFRSSHLAEVPPESPISRLELRTLVTLQSRVEVKHMGAPVPASRRGVRWEHIPMGDEWFNDEGYTRVAAEPGREHLAFVMHFRADWQRFFKLLAERDVYPLLFHCSAGRDRTGVGAAMLLAILGVERDRIVADFLESNLVFTKMPLLAEQLDPVFELIEESGGIEGFMHEVIGLAPAELAIIREDLLED